MPTALNVRYHRGEKIPARRRVDGTVEFGKVLRCSDIAAHVQLEDGTTLAVQASEVDEMEEPIVGFLPVAEAE